MLASPSKIRRPPTGSGGKDSSVPNANCEGEQLESLKRLQALKEKIQKEWDKEHQERLESDPKDAFVPLSLAGDTSKHLKKTAGKKTQERMALLSKDAREKLSRLDIKDKTVVRELESELEKKAAEMTDLRQQNSMYRDMITLRQESNSRREAELEKEVHKLKSLTDTVCVRASNLDQTMASLRNMNRQIQEGAAQLKDTMEKSAEADLLGLIRTYRVRMREVKQQINDQKTVNYEGAKAWIDRHDVLKADMSTALSNLEALEAHNSMLITQNEELKVMTKHQEEQRNTLTSKIAVVKRENKRLDDQIKRIEQQVLAHRQRQGLGTANSHPAKLARDRRAQDERAATAPLGVTRPPKKAIFVDKRQTAALTKVRKQLDEMRRSLKQVRSAHIELLQERTELEVFVRQCLEDVRRDMYRFTVVSTLPRTISGDHVEEKAVLQEYGAQEKKVLIDILNSKLKVLALLHSKMFPHKMSLSQNDLGQFIANDEEDDEAATQQQEEEGRTPRGAGAQQGPGHMSSDPVAELDMDKLWGRWKEWTTTYQTASRAQHT